MKIRKKKKRKKNCKGNNFLNKIKEGVFNFFRKDIHSHISSSITKAEEFFLFIKKTHTLEKGEQDFGYSSRIVFYVQISSLISTKDWFYRRKLLKEFSKRIFSWKQILQTSVLCAPPIFYWSDILIKEMWVFFLKNFSRIWNF